MADIYGTKYADVLDAIGYGKSDDYMFGDNGNDVLYGWKGNDTIDGWKGNDTLYGEQGNDYLLGYDGHDNLYGDSGNDTLKGEKGADDLYGGTGVDKLYGGTGSDYFYFGKADSGNVYDGKADTIYDFSDHDQIWLKGNYSYAGDNSAPSDGEYGIWQKGDDWVVTWNAHNDSGYHDLVVKGGDPHGDISFY